MRFIDVDDNQKAESVFREQFAPHYGVIHRAISALPGFAIGHDGCDVSSYPSCPEGGWGVDGLSGIRGGEWEFRIFWRSAEECRVYGYFSVTFADDGSVLSFAPKE
jgi:hypothetical protein